MMKRMTAWVAAAVLALECFGAYAEKTEGAPWESGSGTDMAVLLEHADMTKVTTVITEPFYEGVTDAESAEEALGTVLAQLGADADTELMLESVYDTEDLCFYTFRQIMKDVVVEGASAKLIADRNGTAVCAVASLVRLADVAVPEAGELSAEEAEQAVAEAAREGGRRVIPGLTHQAVVEIADAMRLVWVVYTDNPAGETDVGFCAWYVSDEGRVTGPVPVLAPYSTDEAAGSGAELAFAGMESGQWTGEVTLFDGRTREVTVPVMRDAAGHEYLGDLQRKILCADYAAWEYRGELQLREKTDGRFDDGELLIYESIIRVWDFYNALNWPGADGKGTPILVKMDLVDESGEPIQNAYYDGKNRGFQCFAFNRLDRDGETVDVIGHEYTHCVTAALSVKAPYLNDTGAINESLSDIMGNLIEEMLGASEDPEWMIGEAAGNPEQLLRCMSDPQRFRNPRFVWDLGYVPAVEHDGRGADHGGVHHNSSLLSLIAWRLHEAGMAPEDEFYYMMNVILTMTGGINYPQLAILLPWCLEQVKMGEYRDVLEDALEETLIAEVSPVRIPEGCALIRADLPGNSGTLGSDLTLICTYIQENDEAENRTTWPDARLGSIVLCTPADSYGFSLRDNDTGREWMLRKDGWLEVTEMSEEEVPRLEFYFYEENTVYDLPGM